MDNSILLSLQNLEKQEEDWQAFSEAVEHLAISNLPNSFFLQQFGNNFDKELSKITLWEGYAKILVKRGIAGISNVKQQLMTWFQDPCWPGFNDIVQFVVDNKQEFKQELLKVLHRAFEQKEVEWLEYIFLIYEKCYEVTSKQKEAIYSIVKVLNYSTKDDAMLIFSKELTELFKCE